MMMKQSLRTKLFCSLYLNVHLKRKRYNKLPNGQKGWIDLTGERIFGQLKLIQMKTNLFILLLFM